MHLFVILQFYTILICCEAPRTILDLALYQIKYIIIIIIYNHTLTVHALISVPPFLICWIHNYCNLTSVELLKSVSILSIVQHYSRNDTTSDNKLPYCLEKKNWCTLIGIDFLTFFHDPTLIRSNTVCLEIALFHFYCSFLLNLKSSYNI